ncbi:MAG: lipid-A-disaccharide synthase [Bacteroidales bacterium]|nr:lipid-A-disaccharide synthase [Bacteroidales bacterium]
MKYYIIAGEASGDLHGANLIRAIKQQDASADIRFWGGDRMRHEGGTCVRHINGLAYMGVWEVATHLPTVLGNLAFCKEDIEAFHPDMVVLIDYPGFNLKIAKFTHKRGYKNVYYVSPQIWAWKKRRIKNMRLYINALCCILPFEQDFYAQNNFPQACYVGHPLLDEVMRYKAESDAPNTLKEGEQPTSKGWVALMPGSRKQEIRKMMPYMLRMANYFPKQQFVITGMGLIGQEYYEEISAQLGGLPSNVSIAFDQTYRVLSGARSAVVCSGTATLEAALWNVPQVVCYRTSALTALAGRLLLKVKYISLVNLIEQCAIVPELVQNGLTDVKLLVTFSELNNDTPFRTAMLEGYDQLRSHLGSGGASQRVASVIAQTINHS